MSIRAGGKVSLVIPKARLAFLKDTPGQHHAAQTIQRKSGPCVEVFQVPLQAKSGGDQVRAKMGAGRD